MMSDSMLDGDRDQPSEVDDKWPIPSPETMQQHAYLVARGVRALALVGHCDAKPMTMLRAATRLEVAAGPGIVPFVIERSDGVADLGYAATQWAIDLYQWTFSDEAGVPERHRHHIVGLLLGYSPDAIRQFEERCTGRRFDDKA
jgi:hypothetical protein